jgi:flagellar biosynthetic protein FlhB
MIRNLNLQLFAQGGGGGDKTEKATPKKRQDARKKGQVLQSREISSALVLMMVFVTLRVYGSNIYNEILQFTKRVLSEYPKMNNLYMPDIILKIFIDMVTVFFKTTAPVLAVALITGLIAGYAQVGFLFTLEPLKFKFSRINPASGFKRIFSAHGAVELIKSILKILVIGYVSYVYLNGQKEQVIKLMDMDILGIATFIGSTSVNVALRICLVLILLSLFDYAYQWWDFEKNMKMSKQEVKEEYKQTEGNPEIKSKIKQKQRQISMRRMMQEVPKADVVITNPTHFACAVKYDTKVSDAPVLIAKGQDYIALRIKEVAKENKIEVVENKVLARTLFETVDIGKTIPPDLYQAVAEILAFVYSLKGNKRVV